MAVNLLYVIFRFITGIMYSLVWFASMAVYHLVPGTMRAGGTLMAVLHYIAEREKAANIENGAALCLFMSPKKANYPKNIAYCE